MHPRQNSASRLSLLVFTLLLLLSTVSGRALDVSTQLTVERYTLLSGGRLKTETGHMQANGTFFSSLSSITGPWGSSILNDYIPVSGKPIFSEYGYQAYKSAGVVPRWTRSKQSFPIGIFDYVIVGMKGYPIPVPNPVPKPPTITFFPTEMHRMEGNTAKLTVKATGTGPFQYQWQKGLADIPGATGTSYTVDDSSGTDVLYGVRVSNLVGSDTAIAIVWSYPFSFLEGYPQVYWQTPGRKIAVQVMDRTNLFVSGYINQGKAFSAGWTPLLAGDLDNDGRADLIFRHDDGRLSAWLMDGVTRRANVALKKPAAGWRPYGLGDFDGDHKADLFLRHTDGRIALWQMDGTNWLASVPLNNGKKVAAVWKPSFVQDFNRDGKPDVLWRNASGSAAIWLMDGLVKSNSVSVRNGKTMLGWRCAGALDLAYDGYPDLIWFHPDRRMLQWDLDDTTFLNSTPLKAGPEGWRIIATRNFQ